MTYSVIELFHWAGMYSKDASFQVQNILNSCPHFLNQKNKNNETALIISSISKNLPVLDYLLSLENVDWKHSSDGDYFNLLLQNHGYKEANYILGNYIDKINFFNVNSKGSSFLYFELKPSSDFLFLDQETIDVIYKQYLGLNFEDKQYLDNRFPNSVFLKQIKNDTIINSIEINNLNYNKITKI